MITWVEAPREGRDRGLTGILRVWVTMIAHPRQFFRDGVAPDDQAPGFVLAIAIALVYQGLGFAFEPATIPAIKGGPLVLAPVALLAVTLFVAPTLLHLTVAIQTALLIPLLSRHAGVSEAVQVIAYAAAPCAFASLPVLGVRTLCAVYGAALLAVGISKIHQTTVPKAALVAAVPAGVAFGYVFGGFRALSELAAALALVWAEPRLEFPRFD